MPTYVYKNLKTGKVFELEQRITEAVLKTDPKTGHPVERVIQAAGIVFKGGGFYKTDSRPAEKSGKSQDKSPDKAAETSAGKSDAASSKTGDSGPSGSSSSGSSSDNSGSGGTDSSKASSSEKPAKVASSAKSAAKD